MPIDVRLTAHQRAMATDPVYRAGYEGFLQDRQRRKEERNTRQSQRRRRGVLLTGWLWCRLPMPRVFLHGPRWWRFMVEGNKTNYDFAEDVRELVCERIRFDVVAEWTDPREWLGR